jgi:hypothetical protein
VLFVFKVLVLVEKIIHTYLVGAVVSTRIKQIKYLAAMIPFSAAEIYYYILRSSLGWGLKDLLALAGIFKLIN